MQSHTHTHMHSDMYMKPARVSYTAILAIMYCFMSAVLHAIVPAYKLEARAAVSVILLL